MNSPTETPEGDQGCEFTHNLEILRQIDLFARLPIESLKVFAYLCERETYQPEDVLFRQGENDGQAYYIIDGSARLVDADQDPATVLRSYGPGTFLGRLALTGQLNRLYTLMAETRVHCLLLSREKFMRSLEKLYQFQTGLTPRITYGPNRRIGVLGSHVVTVDLEKKNFVPVGEWIEISSRS